MSATREERIDALLAREEIAALLTRWCRGLDRGDEVMMASCYHADAVDDHGEDVQSGATAARAFVERHDRAFVRQQHLLLNITIALDGDLAAAESYVTGLLVPRSEGAERLIMSSGRFLDRLERRDRDWRFIHRRWIRESVVDVTQLPHRDYMRIVLGTAAAEAPAAPHRGTRSRDDPSYEYLPEPVQLR